MAFVSIRGAVFHFRVTVSAVDCASCFTEAPTANFAATNEATEVEEKEDKIVKIFGASAKVLCKSGS